MLATIARIRPDVVRLPLLCAIWPFMLLDVMIGTGLLRWRRLLERDLYALAMAVFWAAWDGRFVPERRDA